ncbi:MULTISPECIES: LamG-like jellyroll fold domain-containing protein [unclassified Lentimicrobium]|uniref:LamG-like jellyroll fold domain-containing protein n=1 Tax=unclassified Lentimicrobium TaxID=2677434 RepID=UPI0015531680|nr:MULTISPECIES: LamG-like jellyroll fold domain-containing protein [unclassified Lentimicrobium]NPD48002.1 T9SS type A sorting domain-containing protein [Lentimicrobium sp. S6]NPD86631.1 T9SS type A sorting domain-containing protein [Lentimicrobium sp. L6]
MKKTVLFILTAVLITPSFAQTNNSASAYLTYNGNLATGNAFEVTTQYTLEAWIYPTTTSGDNDIIAYTTLDYTSPARGYRFSIGQGKLQLIVYNSSGTNTKTSTAAIPTNEWTHVAAVINNSSSVVLYINGIASSSSSSGNNDFSPDYYSSYIPKPTIGGYYYDDNNTGKYFNGRIDEARIWNDARSETEINDYMHRDIADGTNPGNLVCWLDMNSTISPGSSVNDLSSNNYNFTSRSSSSNTYGAPVIIYNSSCFEVAEALWYNTGTNWSITSDGLSLKDYSGTLDRLESYSFANNNQNGTTSSGCPTGVELRANQVWYFNSEADDAINFLFQCDNFAPLLDNTQLEADDYKLLSSSSSSGPFTSVSSGISVSGDDITFENVTPTNGYYYTIGRDNDPATVTTSSISNITPTTATGGGNVTADGGSTITARGVCWNTTGSPTTSDPKTTNGSGTGTFTSSITGLSPNTTYYVRAYATNSEGPAYGSEISFTTDYADITWDGSEGTDWNTPGNWSLAAVPTSSNNVTIPSVGITNFPVIASGDGADCNNLTISSGATLTLASGGSLKTAGTVTNDGGTFNAQRTISNGQWHMISSPVSNAVSGMFDGDYLQYWSEEDVWWYDVEVTDMALIPVQGYGFWSDDGETTHTFSGTPNTGTIPFTLSYHNNPDPDAIHDGTNLVGNPYPSAIDWSQLQGNYGTAYIYNPVADDYIENTASAIPPMQGFFICTLNDGSSFSLQNSNRTHGGTFYKNSQDIQNGLLLTASYGEFEDEFKLLFDENANDGFNLIDDSWKFLSSGNGVSQIWSYSIDGKLAIDKRPYTETIQLGFSNSENGFYTLSLKEINGINSIELEDTKLNLFYDLSKGAYSFDWLTSDSEERFILHLKATGTQEFVEQEAQVYSDNGQVYVRMDEADKFEEIMIYDLAGRLLYQNQLSHQNLQSFDLSHLQGAYLVQLISGSGTQVEKVILE